MSGSIHITGDATVTIKNDTGYGDGAGIGSGDSGEMSGSIIIDGNASVDSFSNYNGAGIGSGDGGEMSVTSPSAAMHEVTAVSRG